MALTQIADVVVPEVFTGYVQLLTAQRSAFVQSGVIETSPMLDALLAGGGRTFNLPHFKDLDDTEANVSADQAADVQSGGANDATPIKTTTGQEIAQRHNRNQSWSSADLAAALAGADPMESIASRVADYWVRQQQRYLISSLQGVFADNIANDTGDMVNSIVIGGPGTVTDAHLFSADAFIDTAQTSGDFAEDLVAVAVHSVVFSRMQKLNLIDFIPDSEGRIQIPFYLGRRVIVDDGLPVVDDGNGHFEYSSYLFGTGSVAAGVGSPRVPTEVHREPLAGQGGGQEVLTSRVEWILHPRGTAWLGASQAGESPTIAEMQLAANWDRRFERKLLRIAELRTNG